MASYLFTLAPPRQWGRPLEGDILMLSRRRAVTIEWKCTKAVLPRDRAFFCFQDGPRGGVFGSGWILSTPDEERRPLACWVQLTALVPMTQKLPISVLESGALKDTIWRRQKSGCLIPDHIASQLEVAWAKHLTTPEPPIADFPPGEWYLRASDEYSLVSKGFEDEDGEEYEDEDQDEQEEEEEEEEQEGEDGGIGIEDTGDNPEEQDSDAVSMEGAQRVRLRNHRQRESRLREKKIAEALQRDGGRLICRVPGCGFDYVERYGELGRGYAHVHHLAPLSSRTEDSPTPLEDLIVVCANCHAMIHRNGDCLPPDKVQIVGSGFRRPRASI